MRMPMVWSQLLNINPEDTTLAWQPFREGVDILPLYEGDPTESKCALLRYQPLAAVPTHEHRGVEYLMILQGAQQDENGIYPAGTFIINPPMTRHTVSSVEGCIVLAIWDKPVRFIPTMEAL